MHSREKVGNTNGDIARERYTKKSSRMLTIKAIISYIQSQEN